MLFSLWLVVGGGGVSVESVVRFQAGGGIGERHGCVQRRDGDEEKEDRRLYSCGVWWGGQAVVWQA